jgi:hypothetical protein
MTRWIIALVGAVIVASPIAVTDAQPARRIAPPTHFQPPGHEIRRLPRGQVRISVGPERYHYYDGMFFRPLHPGYVVVTAPIGARVRTLPLGYISFAIGPRNYFYVNSTYYLWEPRTREYVVVEEPDGAADRLEAAQEPSDAVSMFVYPNEGQDQQQTRKDRYECHLWAAEQSGYDPTYSNQPAELRGDYRRAMTACLEGRGYTVR